MAAPTDVYVDPSLNSDYGSGTLGDPYGDAQAALDQVGRDATNGNSLNIKSGVEEVLIASLDLTLYGVPTQTAPLIIQGYNSVARDGGIGTISGDGSFGVMVGDVYDYVHFKNMHLYNCGSSDVISLDNNCSFENCEISDTLGNGIDIDNLGLVFNCYIHNIGNVGVFATTTSLIYGNYFENGVNQFSDAIGGISATISSNVINLSGAGNSSNGIIYSDRTRMINNSIWSDSGVGSGIYPGGTNRNDITILNNVIEGFSGSGGIGIELSSDDDAVIYGYNAVYNCETPYAVSGDIWFSLGSNETLISSPFTDPSLNDFTTTELVAGTAFPQSYKGSSTKNSLDKGASQRKEPDNTSDYAENQILDYVLRNTADWAPATVYLGLFASDPKDDQTYFGEELFGDAYVRQAVTFGSSNNGIILNSLDILFPIASPSYWNTITHFGIFDNLVDGNMLFSGSFLSPVNVAAGDRLRITAGSLSIQQR